MGPLSLSVPDYPLGRSPAPHLAMEEHHSLTRFFRMKSRWRGLGHSCVSREDDGQSVKLQDSCVDWTGARTGVDLESKPQFCWRFV